jgi:electron transfer flavoprotein beta subunit
LALNIVACVKQVPATNEVKMNPETNTIIREGVESILNPFDAYAVEEAVRLRERYGGKATVLSMGIPSVAATLRDCIAVGIDEAVLLSDRAFAGADTLATAYALSLGVRALGGADLVICGKQASDGDTAQVGPSLAERLGVPHATYVNKVLSVEGAAPESGPGGGAPAGGAASESEPEGGAPTGGGAIRVTRMTEDGYERLLLPLPAVITVVKEINEPRLPSIKGMLRAKKAEVRVLTAADVGADPARCGLAGSPTHVVRTFVPRHDVKSEMLEGTEQEQAAALIARLRALTTGGAA